MKKIFSILVIICLLFAAGCSAREADNGSGTVNQSSSENDTASKESTVSSETSQTDSSDASSTTSFKSVFGDSGVSVKVPSVYTAPENVIVTPELESAFDFEEIVPVEVATQFQNLELEDIEIITEKQTSILSELKSAFSLAGLNVSIDESTGKVSFDSSILFGGDSSKLSAERKSFLKKFIKAYSSVMLSDEFDGFIKEILVEGHTAPIAGSTYESGLPLSKERAEKVKNYCLSSDSGLSKAQTKQLAKILKSAGKSNSEPVLDSKGNVDLAASRRVTFRFYININ